MAGGQAPEDGLEERLDRPGVHVIGGALRAEEQLDAERAIREGHTLDRQL